MRTELVTIQTPTIPIDGAFHQPDGAVTAGAVLLFHGNTMNFYTGMARFLPPVLTKLGFACLAFNRRGHDVVTTRNSRAPEGGAFQTTAEAIEDNRIAAQWLAQKGYAHPVVIGHSNGGMLATRHVSDHPQTPALVMLSAGRGGPSTMKDSGRDGLGASHREGRPARNDRGLHVLRQQDRAPPFCLGAHAVHQVRAGDAVGEARKVFDLGRRHELAAPHAARAQPFKHEGAQPRPGGVDGGRVAGGAGADDDDGLRAGACVAGW